MEVHETPSNEAFFLEPSDELLRRHFTRLSNITSILLTVTIGAAAHGYDHSFCMSIKKGALSAWVNIRIGSPHLGPTCTRGDTWTDVAPVFSLTSP